MSFIVIHMSLGSMLHVDFKKRLCPHVEFWGQWPLSGQTLCEGDCRGHQCCPFTTPLVRPTEGHP